MRISLDYLLECLGDFINIGNRYLLIHKKWVYLSFGKSLKGASKVVCFPIEASPDRIDYS